MASLPEGGAASLSLRHGVRCVVEPGVTVEDVLLAAGEQIGYDNICSASRMNKAVVIFFEGGSLGQSSDKQRCCGKWRFYCFTAGHTDDESNYFKCAAIHQEQRNRAISGELREVREPNQNDLTRL